MGAPKYREVKFPMTPAIKTGTLAGEHAISREIMNASVALCIRPTVDQLRCCELFFWFGHRAVCKGNLHKEFQVLI
jgi:hypothetical protein